MAKFLGTTQGSRGQATRTSGTSIKSSVQSYDGSVITEMHYNEGKLMVRISLDDDSSCYGDTAFLGTFEELRTLLEKNRLQTK